MSHSLCQPSASCCRERRSVTKLKPSLYAFSPLFSSPMLCCALFCIFTCKIIINFATHCNPAETLLNRNQSTRKEREDLEQQNQCNNIYSHCLIRIIPQGKKGYKQQNKSNKIYLKLKSLTVDLIDQCSVTKWF